VIRPRIRPCVEVERIETEGRRASAVVIRSATGPGTLRFERIVSSMESVRTYRELIADDVWRDFAKGRKREATGCVGAHPSEGTAISPTMGHEPRQKKQARRVGYDGNSSSYRFRHCLSCPGGALCRDDSRESDGVPCPAKSRTMELPAVSILIPARDEAANRASAIVHALAQTVIAVEVTVLNDGSTDGTTEFVTGLARHDPRVRLAPDAVAQMAGHLGQHDLKLVSGFPCRSCAHWAKLSRCRRSWWCFWDTCRLQWPAGRPIRGSRRGVAS